MDLGNKLFYTRDRLMENSLWAVGEVFEPQFGYYRKMATRITALITALDDAYDVYGTLEELEVFTDVIERLVLSVDLFCMLLFSIAGFLEKLNLKY
jgi:hypothetical protein